MTELLVLFGEESLSIAFLKCSSLAEFVKDLQQSVVRLEPLGGSFERASGLGEHQGIGAPLALKRRLDIVMMPANHVDQMLAPSFGGLDSSDFVGGVGQEGLELGTVLARARHVRGASSIGGRRRL